MAEGEGILLLLLQCITLHCIAMGYLAIEEGVCVLQYLQYSSITHEQGVFSMVCFVVFAMNWCQCTILSNCEYCAFCNLVLAI